MLNRKENPIGLDFIIDQTQKRLYDKLTSLWDVNIKTFPRCYVLEKEEIRSIQHYQGNNEYSGSLIESEDNKFFFTAEDDQERINNIQFKTKVQLYFILDLKSIYPNSKERVDNQVLIDVVKALDSCSGFDSKINIVTDYQSVFEGFDYDFDNIQPYYCFRVELNTMPYSIDENC
jgi:hypothetical protein